MTKIQGCNRKNVSSVTREVLEYNIKSFDKNVSKIRNVVFIFQNVEKNLKNAKNKIAEIHKDSE